MIITSLPWARIAISKVWTRCHDKKMKSATCNSSQLKFVSASAIPSWAKFQTVLLCEVHISIQQSWGVFNTINLSNFSVVPLILGLSVVAEYRFVIARHQFTLTICLVYSKQPELTPGGSFVFSWTIFKPRTFVIFPNGSCKTLVIKYSKGESTGIAHR